LKDIPAVEPGATAINAALQRSGLQPDEIGTIVMGNTVQAGNKMNPVRQAAIHGGLPVQVPAMTVNRVCGSGAQAIVSAAHEILMGSLDAAIAGGMENMDAAPYVVACGRWGHRMGDGVLYDSVLRDGLNDAFSDQHSGWHTEDLVTNFQIVVSSKTNGHCVRTSASQLRRPRENSPTRSLKLRFLGERVRARLRRMSITGRTQQSKRWLS
jgi:acetyl-CoA C-acetyltransferase